MSGSKNLILGFCAKLSFDRLAPFIASLRNTAFAGDVCMMVEDVAAETVERLRAHGIIVQRAGPWAQPRMSAGASRYFGYQGFLLHEGEHYAHVMLTDPATSVFQADPFATPLDADIVYTAERRRIGETAAVHEAVVQCYGEAVAENLRDFAVSNSDTMLGTRSGVLRYLAEMAHQIAGRTFPITNAVHQGVHNYVVHMRAMRGAWLDAADRVAVTLDAVPDDAVAVAEQAVLIGGSPTAVLSRWDANPKVRAHVRASPRFALPGAASVDAPAVPATDAVLAFYRRERDADWLTLFLGSLRCVNGAVRVHCIGDFSEGDLAVLARYGCTAHAVPATEPAIAENVAHFYLSQALDQLAADPAPPQDVLLLDGMRAFFPRDPLLSRSVGMSVFCEGPARIGDSDYNRDRLGFFAPLDERRLREPVISSMVLRGRLQLLRDFYRRMFLELVGRAELLQIHKVVQGIVNKLCRDDDLGFPVTVHPNGAEVLFDFLGSRLALDTRRGVHLGGTVPGVVLAGHPESPLMLRLRIDLNLAEP